MTSRDDHLARFSTGALDVLRQLGEFCDRLTCNFPDGDMVEKYYFLTIFLPKHVCSTPDVGVTCAVVSMPSANCITYNITITAATCTLMHHNDVTWKNMWPIQWHDDSNKYVCTVVTVRTLHSPRLLILCHTAIRMLLCLFEVIFYHTRTVKKFTSHKIQLH